MTRTPVTRSNAIKRQNLKLINKGPGKTLSYREIFHGQPRDLVLICQGGERLEYHSQILINISKTLTDILQNERLFNNFFLPSDYKVYVTIDGIKASTVQTIMETVYQRQDLKCLEGNKHEIRNFLEALGISDKFYTIIEDEKDEEKAMVDVISNLIEGFDVAPVQTDLVEFLMEGIDDSFINDLSSSFDGEDSLLNMESLLSEESDEVRHSTIEEAVEEGKIEASESLSINSRPPPSPRNLTFRPCFVELENIPTKTLSHYFGILKRKESLDHSSENITQISAKPQKKKPRGETVLKKEETKKAGEKNTRVETENSTFQGLEDGSSGDSMTRTEVKVGESSCRGSEVLIVEVKEICCLYCTDKFPSRSRLLQHITYSHHQQEILQRVPFVRGECPLCIEQGRPKPFVIKAKAGHLIHIGQTHGILQQLLPEEFKAKLDEFRKTGRGRGGNKLRIKQEPLVPYEDSNLTLDSMDSFFSANESFQESFTKSIQAEGTPAETERFFHNEDANMSAPVLAESRDSGIETGEQDPGTLTEPETATETETVPEPETVTELEPGIVGEIVGGVECSICPRSDSVMFQQKSEMLSHLSWIHLSNELLTLFPPAEDDKCGFCNEGFSSQEEYIKHTGMSHEKVLEILPSDFCDKILSMGENNYQTEAEQVQIDQDMSSPDLTLSPAQKEDQQAIPKPRKLDFKFILSSEKTDNLKGENCEEKAENKTEKAEKTGAPQNKSFSCRYCGELFTQSKNYRLHLLAHRDKLINKSKQSSS